MTKMTMIKHPPYLLHCNPHNKHNTNELVYVNIHELSLTVNLVEVSLNHLMRHYEDRMICWRAEVILVRWRSFLSSYINVI
jgi:hypothetical protein